MVGVRGAPRDAAAGRVETDTITFGAFRPAAFELAGLFDESLRRNQDDELNLRVRAAGGRVVLDPSIRVRYTPRGSLRGVFAQYFEYGYWKVAVLWKHRQPPSARSLAPLAFVTSLAALGRFTKRLTHKIDPHVDAARDYLLTDLFFSGRLAAYGHLAGVGAATRTTPRFNYTGDPYHTDGRWVVLVVSTQEVPWHALVEIDWEDMKPQPP